MNGEDVFFLGPEVHHGDDFAVPVIEEPGGVAPNLDEFEIGKRFDSRRYPRVYQYYHKIIEI